MNDSTTQHGDGREGLADIVVGVDGSDESFAALKWAMHEAAITGQHVNAVFGWTHSWDVADDEPDSEDAWSRASRQITDELHAWVDRTAASLGFDADKLTMTSVHASGTSALLQLGKDAQQIVVGRRSLGRVARWFMGSLSASLAEEAQVPVTVVRIAGSEDESVTDAIANALTPGDRTVHYVSSEGVPEASQRPVVVGVDGSKTSLKALEFAAHEARIHDLPLHVLLCWQLKDLGTVPGYENAVPSIEVGQRRAEEILTRMLDDAALPPQVRVVPHTFHIPASKGLIAASRYASRLVVGSRGLNGLDAHFLGSVSRQIVNFSECTVTVVH